MLLPNPARHLFWLCPILHLISAEITVNPSESTVPALLQIPFQLPRWTEFCKFETEHVCVKGGELCLFNEKDVNASSPPGTSITYCGHDGNVLVKTEIAKKRSYIQGCKRWKYVGPGSPQAPGGCEPNRYYYNDYCDALADDECNLCVYVERLTTCSPIPHEYNTNNSPEEHDASNPANESGEATTPGATSISWAEGLGIVAGVFLFIVIVVLLVKYCRKKQKANQVESQRSMPQIQSNRSGRQQSESESASGTRRSVKQSDDGNNNK